MAEKRFWCLERYEGETSPIVDERFTTTNGWLCNKLNELYEENEQLKQIVAFYKAFQKDARELEKENEQLKQLLKSINGSFTFDDNYASWFEDCIVVSKEGLKEIDLGSDFE